MPSPIAHSSVAFIAWPALRGDAGDRPAGWRRLTLLAALLLALVAPDLDLALGIAFDGDAFSGHGGYTHSLVAGVGFAAAFAVGVRLLIGRPWGQLWLIGGLVYWSHVFLDACTRGRGVMLLWPLSADRFRLAYPLFYGVKHSPWGTWRDYAIMLLTELVFAGLVWLLSRRFHVRWSTPDPSR